ncbi:ATP-binding protein [Kibdelosporangium aridum]|uniref:ATP-binding protein n=1 Tax=Kibdelosporangium aridum TaxID=2030 RepID=UPI000689D35A
MLASSSVVTLTGIGGVGKTALALRVAVDVQRDSGCVVWFVKLDKVGNPDLLPHAVAEAVGVTDRTTRPAEEAVCDFLANQHALLLLDNCEHLLGAVADLVQRLLTRCPDLKVLSTSRRPLGMLQESVYQLGGLSVPGLDVSSKQELERYDAVQLFVERARSALGGFVITERNEAAVSQICRQLEGVPLALELATARLRAMSPQELADRLGQSIRLLSVDRFGSGRQRTLRACIEWSHDLCTSREQMFWHRLAVFAGSYDIEAIEGICGPWRYSTEAAELVDSLVEKSILLRESFVGRTRFRLPEIFRQFAAEKLVEHDDAAGLTKRHLDWYAGIAAAAETNWFTGTQVIWLTRLKQEHANLQLVLDRCVGGSTRDATATGLRMATSLHHYWWITGRLAEGRYYLSMLRRRPGSLVSDALLLASLRVEMWLALMQVDLDAAQSMLTEFDVVKRRLSAPGHRVLAATRNQIAGTMALCAGDIGLALEQLESARRVFSAAGEHARHAEVLLTLIMCGSVIANYRLANRYGEALLALADAAGEMWFRAYAYWALGVSAWRTGDIDGGAQALLRALVLSQQTEDPVMVVLCMEGLAWAAASDQKWSSAAKFLGAAEKLSPQAANTMIPAYIEYHDSCERAVRQAMGKRQFDGQVKEGWELSLSDLIVLASHDWGSTPGTPHDR